VLVGVNLHGDVNPLKIFLATAETRFLPARGTAAPVHGEKHEDDEDGYKQFDEGKSADCAGAVAMRAELRQLSWIA
jgi:hypothetical protein